MLAGGLEEIQLVSPFGQATVAAVSVYDVATDAWVAAHEAASTMPDTRDHACGAVVGRKFYVLGGRERECELEYVVLVVD